MRNQQVTGVQYLRGIAAIGVVGDHVAGMTAFPKYFGHTVLLPVLSKGAIGVDLFFLISGFIMALISLDIAGEPRLTRAEFFKRRFFRIVPFMWLAIAAYAALRLVGRGDADFLAYFRAIFLVPIGRVEPNNIWTLRHELIFYAVFAATFLGRRGARWLLGGWVLSPLVLVPLGFTFDATTGWRQAVSIFANPVNLEFGAGVIVGLAWVRRPWKRGNLPIDPSLALSLLFVGVVLVASALDLKVQDLRSVPIAIALCAPLLVLGIGVKCPNSRAGKVALGLGDASYAIYLFHPHLVSAMLGVWAKCAHGTPVWVVIPSIAALAIGGGYLIHLAVEKPLLRILRRLTERRTAPVSVAA